MLLAMALTFTQSMGMTVSAAEEIGVDISDEEGLSDGLEMFSDRAESPEIFSDEETSDVFSDSAAAAESKKYDLSYEYVGSIGNGSMLPNSQMTIKISLISREDTGGWSNDTQEYELKLRPITGDDYSRIADVSLDNHDIQIQSHGLTGWVEMYVDVLVDGVKVYENYLGFSITEYVLLPENVTDAAGNIRNPEVGEQIDIVNDMKPQLVRYKDGKGDPIPVTGDDYKIIIFRGTDGNTGEALNDYDTTGWKWIDVPGQELPILERTTANDTQFALCAMKRYGDGRWGQIARRMYQLDPLDNGVDSGHEDYSEDRSSYVLGVDFTDSTGNGAMLPNSQMTIETRLADKGKDYQLADDYKLEIIEQSKNAEVSVSADGKKLLVHSKDKTGSCCCYVSVQIPDGNGGYTEAFRKDIWFTVSEIMLMPQTLTDKSGNSFNPGVGETIDLANLGVKLVKYEKGQGNPIELSGDNIKIVVSSWVDQYTGKREYDINGWDRREVEGQDLPILTRTSRESTWFSLAALEKGEDGQWIQIARKQYNVEPNASRHKHTWNTIKVIKKADCTSDGSRIDECTSCDAVETVKVPAGHTKVTDVAVAATVFKTGKTEGSHCKVCGAVIKKQKTTAKLKPTISLTASSLKLKTGQSTTAFKASGLAKGDYVKKVTSSDTGVVKVSAVKKDGTFKLTAGKKTGNASVTVTLASKKTVSFKVAVQKSTVKTTKITSTVKKLTLAKGTTYTKLASSITVAPVTSQEKITYSSSDKKIVTVTSKGVVKGVRKGTATITIRSGSKKITCKITVK